MKRHALLLALLLLAPVGAFAQPARDPADTVTGVVQPPPGVQVRGLNPSKLKDYVAAVQAVDATIDFETSGQTRNELKVDSFTLRSTWRASGRPNEPAVLTGMEITPKAGQRLAGKINKVTVDNRGRMHVDVAGMPDVTISKMTRDRHGNLVLHTDEWLIPDIHVRASDGKAYVSILGIKKEVGDLGMLLKLEHWPPRLDDLAKLAEGKGNGPPLTGTVRYDIRASADANGLPLPSALGRANGTANMATRGAIRLEPDGTVRSLGDANVELELRVGSRGANLNGVRAGEGTGHVAYNGRYKLSIPAGNLEKTHVVADGDVSFALNGRDMVMNLPSGARVMAGAAEMRGRGRLGADLVGGAGSFTLHDGTYRLRLNGPVGVEGLAIPGLVAENLRGTGELNSAGTFALAGDQVSARGDLKGRVTTTEGPEGTGFLRAMGQDGSTLARARVRSGSTVDVDLSSVELGGKPANQPNELPDMGNARATGKVTADLHLDQVHVNDPRFKTTGGSANLNVAAELDGRVALEGERATPGGNVKARATVDADLTGVNAKLPDGSLEASRLHLDGNGDLVVGTDGVTLTDGRIKARLDGDGALDTGLPGGPVGARRPAARTPERTAPAPRADGRATVANMGPGSKLNLRSGPGTGNSVLGKLDLGTPLRVLSSNGDWSQVETADGRRGYVHNNYLSALEAPASNPAPVAVAEERPVARNQPAAPAGRVRTTLAAGTEADVALDRVHVGRNGAITASGRVVSAKVLLGPTDLRAGSFQAKVLGSARAALANVPFEVGPNGVRLPQKVSVPVRVELAPGSKVTLNMPGRETEVSLDRPGSYAEFTAQVTSDASGVHLDELTNVDLKLVTTAAARLMGDMAQVNGEKSLEFKGRVAFVDGGFDLYGDLAVRVHGDDRTPILRVRP